MAKVEQSFDAHTNSIDRYGNYTSIEIPYIVFEVSSEEEALTAALAEAPQEYQGLPLDSLEIDTRKNDTTFKINATYKADSSSGGGGGGGSPDDPPTLSFDCGGGTKHITHSISQTIAHGTKNAGGAIGWNGKPDPEMEIAGVDVPTAQLRETYTKVILLSSITTTYKRLIASIVGKVNSKAFKGWAPGEVMFLGMSYSCPAKGSTKVTVTFNFAIQLNETNAQIGSITVSKKGFEYVWALSSTSIVDGVPKADIEAVYVDKVCEEADFALLGL